MRSEKKDESEKRINVYHGTLAYAVPISHQYALSALACFVVRLDEGKLHHLCNRNLKFLA